MSDAFYFGDEEYQSDFENPPHMDVSSESDSDVSNNSRDGKEEFSSIKDDMNIPDEETIKKYVFESVNKAERFYMAYARHYGFDVTRKGSKKEGPDGETVINSLWRCTCYGAKDDQVGAPRVGKKGLWKVRKSIRCGCEASFRVALDRTEHVYRVTKLVNTHNHPLVAPENRDELKSSRVITARDKNLFTTFRTTGLRTRDGLDFVEQISGGPESLNYERKDAYNYVIKVQKDSVKEGDIRTTLIFLEGMRANDSSIYIKTKKDPDDNTLTCLVYTNGFSREAYKRFKDVLVFDSTYKTNCYNFTLVFFCGADNHKKTVIFGTALMKEETIFAYTWLLNTFKDAMEGMSPTLILTDQDQSMKAAISTVFPGVKHRICCWHLLRNAAQHIKGKSFKADFTALLMKYSTPLEFEEEWRELVEKHSLEDNTWIKETYAKREKWAETYFRGHFMGMMRSTQRAESLNAIFKGKGKAGNKVLELLQLYQKVIRRMCYSFNCSQTKSERSTPVANHKSGMYKFQKHAASVYTEAIYCEVLNEIEGESRLLLVDSVVDSPTFNFDFTYFYDKTKLWSVDIHEEAKTYVCTCQKLESDGFPCSHLFAAFKHMGRTTIPEECILPRWTIDIGKDLRIIYSKVKPNEESRNIRLAKLFAESNHHDWIASQTEEATNNGLKRMRKSTKIAVDEIRKEAVKVKEPKTKKNKKEHDINDPEKIRSKGARKGEEQHCSLCNEASHKAPQCHLYQQ